MTERSLDTSTALRVFSLLALYFGSAFSQSTTTSTVTESSSIQPSPTVSGSLVQTSSSEVLGNASTVSASSGILNTATSAASGNLNPSSVASAQSSSVQMNLMPLVPSKQDIEQDFGPLAEELGQIISKEIDPKSSKPSDVKVLKTLIPLMEKSVAFLVKYNESGNASIDYFNITESLVLIIRKFDCIEDRAAEIPDRSNRSTRQDLGKVTDYAALTFDCPKIVINDTHPGNSHSRKRRDVQFEVTMEISAEEEDGDFHEFQLLHHHTRFRRSAPVQQQCGPLKCGVQRFETYLIITNKVYNRSLTDEASAFYNNLKTQLTTALTRLLASYLTVDSIHINKYERKSSYSDDVKATFYLDVNGPEITEANVTAALSSILVNKTLDALNVDTFGTKLKIVVDGNYTEWTQWSACYGDFDTKRTRTCQGHQNGGKCHGPPEETRKCDCVHHEKVGGNITSPLFPGNYPAGVRCKWVLEAPVNHTVKLFLEEFHLEQDKKCFYDFMEFFDGNTTEEEHRIGNRMCGNHGPRTFQSTGQKLSIVFNSDKSVTFKGFRAEWQTKEIKEKVIEYVPQFVTALTMVYSPKVNGTHYPLGTATTCTSDSKTIDQECVFKEKVFVISRLISARIDRDLSLAGGNRIVINFVHIMNERLFPAMYNGQKYCVTWNEKAKKEQPADDSDPLQTTGGWTRRGCSVVTTNITHTACACDHQGLFAVLGQEKIESSKLKLLANTYIGLGISYFILILAIVHIVWKIEVHGGEVMRINMCAAIIVMQSVFLIGAHVKAQQTLCGFLAFAVYFSVLAEFCWLLLHGLRIHGKIKKLFASNLNIEIVYVVIGWGLPMLLALIAIGVQIDLKNPDDVCWEAAAGSAMWGYAGPVIIIALFNVAILLKLLIPTQDVKDGYDYKEMRFRVLKDFVFLLFFGLTCTFAYQAVEEERFFEQYLLSAFVIMQALAMFVFGREGRKDFIKRPEEAKQEAEPEPAFEEPEENVYEDIEPETKPEETDLGEGRVRRPRKRASNKQPEKITVSTLKNLNIYKEGGQYVIEA